ncbi:hypothetical protein D9758_004816 [Tetrapyrgos nigripes]|uniref:glucan endo-1,3-beta-D-glucosidase n=1 Tax=Tetrapyrgos nigripes TaxID=182062 RepID=A0A8H5G610_9AGAR|nr:hypothetical protein D9758_004816 [Tetrapyrgos nigripes]
MPGRSRRRWILIGSIVGLVALIAIGVGVGVGVTRNNDNDDNDNNRAASASSSGNSSTGSTSDGAPAQTDPNDPSTFVRDSRLHQSFWGMAYTPEGSQLPNCSNSLENVIKDIQLMSQLTSRIRLYGADCNQSALVLEAIKQTKTNVSVYLGIFNVPDDHTAYTRQRDLVKEALQTYGTDHVLGVTVGNEFMLNYLNDKGSDDPNSSIGDEGAQLILADIADTRSMLSEIGVSLPVGNSDAGFYFNNKVLAGIDYGMSNVHAWFANTTIQAAAGWVNDFFQETNVQPTAALPNHPKMYIAETGWPTESSDEGNKNNGASDASEANLQIFLDTFVCQANTNGTGYFFFEYFDEPWKDAQFGGVEGWWGLFDSNRTLKNIQIPDCPSS